MINGTSYRIKFTSQTDTFYSLGCGNAFLQKSFVCFIQNFCNPGSPRSPPFLFLFIISKIELSVFVVYWNIALKLSIIILFSEPTPMKWPRILCIISIFLCETWRRSKQCLCAAPILPYIRKLCTVTGTCHLSSKPTTDYCKIETSWLYQFLLQWQEGGEDHQ